METRTHVSHENCFQIELLYVTFISSHHLFFEIKKCNNIFMNVNKTSDWKVL
jgi:hypothetical protein